MSTHSKNWFKLSGLVALAFVLGLFIAGLLNVPRTGEAEASQSSVTPIVTVNAPRIPEAKPLADLSDAYSAIAEAVRPSVVFVQAERPEAAPRTAQKLILPPGFELPDGDQPPARRPAQPDRSTGSGFIVSADGYIVTNHHVIEGATRVRVRLLDGRTFDARLVGSDPNTDVAVLRVDATGLTPAALGSSAKLRVGEWVLAIGNPLGDDLTFSVTQGIVSAKGRGPTALVRSNLDIQDFIQTDAAINRGNSGGPLINVRGEVVGINSAIASLTGYYQGYAFAVPIDLARAVMNQIIEHGRVERTKLGILVETATAEDAAYLGLDTIGGVKINDFEPANDSPAKRAGLEAGDVIIAIDGQPVKYTAQLQQLVGFRRAGETVRVEVARSTGRKEFTVRLENVGQPELIARDSAPDAPAAAPRSGLGLVVEPLTAVTASQVGLPSNIRGLLVRKIAPGSPAEERLLSAEDAVYSRAAPDVITAVEGRAVRTEADFRSALSSARNGIISLTVVTGAQGTAQSRVVRVRVGTP
ncbi:MAG: trypsin-like peptidase domain-containing protein [Gemmatimonadales bacterium]